MIEVGMKTPPADKNEVVTSKYKEAYNLNVRICTNAQMAQQHLYDMCMGLKEMRDGKLYKELGYQNFEEYCEAEVGIKRNQAYKMITIVENLPPDFVSSRIQNGVNKLALLARLDESDRTEITENTDLESTSVRELEAKIKQLKEEKDKETDMLRHEKKTLSDKLDEAEERIEELENRPIEIAVQNDSHEVENLKKAMRKLNLDFDLKCSELQEENLKDARKHYAEMNALKEDYEKRLAEAGNSSQPDIKEVFKAYLSTAVDSAKRLLSFIEQNPNEIFKAKTAELFSGIIKKVEE